MKVEENSNDANMEWMKDLLNSNIYFEYIEALYYDILKRPVFF